MKPETSEILDAAEENIRAAEILIKARFFEIAVSRVYYAMHYVAEALLYEENVVCSSHRELQGAFGLHFAKTKKLDPKYHRYLIDGFRKRQVADYQRDADISEEDAVDAIVKVEEFLNAAKTYLASS